MKLKKKLPLAFLFASLLVGIAGLVGIYQLNRSNEVYSRLITIDYANVQAISDVAVNFKGQVQEWKDTLIRGKDPAQLTKYWKAFQQRERAIAEQTKALHKTIADAESRDLVDRFAEAHAAMGKAYRKGFAAFKAAGFDTAVGDAAVKGIDRAPSELLKQAAEKIVQKTANNVARARAESFRATWMSILLMIVGMGGALIAGLALSRSILRPINKAVALAETVASGDLTSHIDIDRADEMGQLLGSLQKMNDSLVNIVRKVRTGTDAIAIASSEIASGSQDLSSRTEQQASSLEETASSTEELTGTVKQNTANAEEARSLAQSASAIAGRGGAVVASVVTTMTEINESAKKIADIVGVIDGIAFQTNILALNAAVEAARAGEQGRGFAVVASEVRSLAQRSAVAAKEIKQLIGDSVAKVENGTTLVNKAGTTMHEVVNSVQRVSTIISEITNASLEQTSGIEQIHDAIAQMDQVTQQNAALVEQASAAAQSLQDEASNLSKLVSVFKVEGDANRNSSMSALVAAPSPRANRPHNAFSHEATA